MNAKLTPWLIQPTTFAEIDGIRTKRIEALKQILKQSQIPYQIVKDMHIWQLCHLAMVVPIADAYYETDIPDKVWRDRKIMWKTARCLRRNFFQKILKECMYMRIDIDLKFGKILEEWR